VGFVPALMGAILLWGVSVFTNFVIKHAKES
jgi:hypothetical protein